MIIKNCQCSQTFTANNNIKKVEFNKPQINLSQEPLQTRQIMFGSNFLFEKTRTTIEGFKDWVKNIDEKIAGAYVEGTFDIKNSEGKTEKVSIIRNNKDQYLLVRNYKPHTSLFPLLGEDSLKSYLDWRSPDFSLKTEPINYNKQDLKGYSNGPATILNMDNAYCRSRSSVGFKYEIMKLALNKAKEKTGGRFILPLQYYPAENIHSKLYEEFGLKCLPTKLIILKKYKSPIINYCKKEQIPDEIKTSLLNKLGKEPKTFTVDELDILMKAKVFDNIAFDDIHLTYEHFPQDRKFLYYYKPI